MRTVFVMTGAYGISGGIATLNKNILISLVDVIQGRESDLTILSLLENDDNRPQSLPAQVKFQAFNGNRFLFTLKLLRIVFLRPLIFFDHVNLALPVLPFAFTGLIETIIFAHGSECWRKIRWTSKLSYKAATLCLTNSNFTLSKLVSKVSKVKGEACLLGLSPDFYMREDKLEESKEQINLTAVDAKLSVLSERFLLLVGRMNSGERLKGHYALLHVWDKIIEKYPDVQLVFAGDGADRINLIDMAKSKGCGNSVFIPGQVREELLKKLYKNCYAYVMPSKQEGFGLVYLEAMSYAKPCIGCYDDGAEEIIVNKETGLLVRDPNDQKELIDTLCLLLESPESAIQMGKKGLKRLRENFTAEHVQDRIKKYLKNILK